MFNETQEMKTKIEEVQNYSIKKTERYWEKWLSFETLILSTALEH